MPSKYRKKSNARKNYYEKHAADGKENAHKYHQEHKETVQCRTAMKKVTDKTGKQKNAVTTRKQLEQDPEKCMNNRIRSRTNTSRRIEVDREYREVNRARARFNTSRKIEADRQYREVNRARARFNTSHIRNKTEPEQESIRYDELKLMQNTGNETEPELTPQQNDWQTTQHIASSALNEQQLQERQNCSKKVSTGSRIALRPQFEKHRNGQRVRNIVRTVTVGKRKR